MREIILDNSEESSDWLHKVAASNPDNRKWYFIEVSRRDVGLVSYCPGWEIKDDPDADWIEDVLVPAVAPIAKRRAARIRETPITFWVTVRRTGRRPAEVFLFVTPAYPGAVIERALSQVLEPLSDGKIHAGREPIPEEAVPCLQIFRGKLIRFYGAFDDRTWPSLPTIWWKNDNPELVLTPSWGLNEFIEEAGQLPVEARIADVLNGELCRTFQRALNCIARDVVLW